MIVNKIIIKAAAFVMIGIMAMMIANRAVFMHTHQLADGTIIEHAHPYDRAHDTNPFKSHHHTRTELVFLDSFKVLFPILFFLLTVCFSPVSSRPLAITPIHYSSACISLYLGRAPPMH
jgi:hypothetical protein